MIKKFMVIASVLVGFAVPAMAGGESVMSVSGASYVDAAGAKSLFDGGAAFVDPRDDTSWNAGRIPGAIHIDSKTSDFNKANVLDEVGSLSDKVVFYCNGPKCSRAAKSSAKAVEWGFTSVYYFRDGFPAWKKAGYPVE